MVNLGLASVTFGWDGYFQTRWGWGGIVTLGAGVRITQLHFKVSGWW